MRDAIASVESSLHAARERQGSPTSVVSDAGSLTDDDVRPATGRGVTFSQAALFH